MNKQDTLLVVLSDMHSGGSTALFVNHTWENDEHQRPSPNRRQTEIYPVFERTIAAVREARKGKRLVVVVNGDAIEGVHHNSIQMVLFNTRSQADVHKELMRTFMTGVNFDPGVDRLFYVRGTETHVNDVENTIGKELGAERSPTGLYVHDHLELVMNDRTFWFVHHGPKAGKGANEGNPVRNWLRDIYYTQKKHRKPVPDVVVTGHVHTATWNVFVAREGQGFKVMHGIICPSWQSKTRYGYKVAAVEVNEIGAVYLNVSADGSIYVPEFVLEETKSQVTVTI